MNKVKYSSQHFQIDTKLNFNKKPYLFDFSSLNRLVVCVSMNYESTECLSFNKIILSFDILNEYLAGKFTVELNLFSPVNSPESEILQKVNKINNQSSDEDLAAYKVIGFEGPYNKLTTKIMTFDIVDYSRDLESLRKYLVATNKEFVKSYKIDNMIETMTIVSIGELTSRQRNFTLSLGARDLRMICNKIHYILYHLNSITY